MYSADVIESHSARIDTCGSPAGLVADNRAVIILIPIRLGGEKINPDYFNFVKVSLVNKLQSLISKNSSYLKTIIVYNRFFLFYMFTRSTFCGNVKVN